MHITLKVQGNYSVLIRSESLRVSVTPLGNEVLRTTYQMKNKTKPHSAEALREGKRNRMGYGRRKLVKVLCMADTEMRFVSSYAILLSLFIYICVLVLRN